MKRGKLMWVNVLLIRDLYMVIKEIFIRNNTNVNIYIFGFFSQWDAFSFPELQNFLRILQREEEDYVRQIVRRYALARDKMKEAMKNFSTPGWNELLVIPQKQEIRRRKRSYAADYCLNPKSVWKNPLSYCDRGYERVVNEREMQWERERGVACVTDECERSVTLHWKKCCGHGRRSSCGATDYLSVMNAYDGAD